MSSTRLLAAAAAVVVSAMPMARAADLAIPLPPPPPEFSGWYLRGDIGMSSQSVHDMHQRYQDVVSEQFTLTSNTFDSAPFFGVGVGYQFNNWLRSDVTFEYRGNANMHLTQTGNQGSVDIYHGSKSEFTTLVNLYADLGTWWCVTPFIGAGVGASYNRIHDFYDQNASPGGPANGQIVAVADGTGTKWSLAWAVYAGLAYQATPNLTLELAYRFIDLGDAQSGWFHNVIPANSVAPGPFQFKDLTSHDVKLGVRWMLDAPPPPPPPLLMRKG
jgi:opacity protein-like surface antigen